jgi:hypothetical protein
MVEPECGSETMYPAPAVGPFCECIRSSVDRLSRFPEGKVLRNFSTLRNAAFPWVG